MDIKPTQNYTLLRTTHQSTEHSTTEVCHSYDPTGRYLGTVTWKRLEQLFSRYHAANADPTIIDFQVQIGLLLMRYSSTSLKNHWATPEQYMLAFASALNHETDMAPDMRELMASPLNVSESTERYCSIYIEDTTFGAEHDAYTFPWVGLNECNPEYEHADMDKAVRWAIGSILQYPNIPTATLMILPDWRGSATAYQRWLAHPLVHEILTIPKDKFQFQTPDFWKTGKLFVGHPKWDVKVLLIANPTGRTAHFDPNRMQATLARAANQLGWAPPVVNTLEKVLRTKSYKASKNSYDTFHIPTKLRKLRTGDSCDTNSTSSFDTNYSMPTNSDSDMHLQLLLSHNIQTLTPAHMQWNATSIIYTDGSCIEKEDGTRALGAGVCRPNQPTQTAHVLPCGVGPTNTINRAELCAIYYAVKHTCCAIHADETIATDSLCSLHMINRGLRRPHTLRHAKHRELISGIIDAVTTRARFGYTTRFIKVKAHTGIKGNELADKIAKEAVDIFWQASTAHNVSIGTDPYGSMFWLATDTPTSDDASKGPPVQHRYVHNLNQDLATRAYNTQGHAGTNESIYANLMKKELSTADKKLSSAMWDLAASGTLTYAHVTNAMRARWGGIYTAKIAARMNRPYMGNHGPPSTGLCPLCHRADSATHILGECPAHKALHIQRHDATGRCILKHMRKGAHGGFFMLADVGSMDKLATYGITHKRIPQWMVPAGAAASPSRFDIAMLHKREHDIKDGGTLPAHGTNLTAIEIGYRPDYDPQLTKLAEKQLQHAPTCAILARQYNLDYQIWDIGHTGMIPKRLRAQATRLGVTNVDKLLKEIHTIAVQHALYIIHERRAKERETLTKASTNTSGSQPTNTHMPVGLQRATAPPR